jgi:hypothetical protein
VFPVRYKLYILPTQCICVFRTVLTINRDRYTIALSIVDLVVFDFLRPKWPQTIPDLTAFPCPVSANEFRLLIEGGGDGTESPAPGGCGPELPLTRNPKKNARRRTICLRAPTAELKAVWQNLIQRQM